MNGDESMKSFDEIYGNDSIKEHLMSGIESGRVSHAYIFNGPAGSGKRMMAEVFAKTLQCEKGGVKPCNGCKSCIQSESGNQPDIIWVEAAKTTSIGVAEIREKLISDLSIRPYSSRYKIYIVDGAEKLTEEAQNALLKSIEEPPEYGIIILLTENADIFLRTVQSRCVRIDFRPLADDLVKEYVNKNFAGITSADERFVTAFARGSIGRAKDLLSNDDFSNIKSQVIKLVRGIEDMSYVDLYTSVKELTSDKERVNDVLDMMSLLFRDILVFKSTNDFNLVILKDELSMIKDLSTRCSYEGIEDVLNSIDKVKVRMKANVSMDIIIELLAMAIKEVV